MQTLVVVKTVRVSGEIAPAGTHVLTDENVEPLIEAGYLRKLSHEENERILDAYYQEAEKVFGKPAIEAIRPQKKAHTQESLL